MSFFNFTRQEQITILFLAFALLVGSVVILVKRHSPAFAPELHLEEHFAAEAVDTIPSVEGNQEPVPYDTLLSNEVDINQATVEELMRLPGIGPKMARRVVAHRDLWGGYETVDDLKAVKGIGDKTVERLRPYIKIGQ